MAAADGFSGLPDDLLIGITFFLHVKDAARTSVLSRRWRPLWLSTDALNLDSRSYGSGRPNKYSRSYGGKLAYQLKDRLFSDAGSAVRAEGRCPVTKLSLFVKGPDDQYCKEVMRASASTLGFGWQSQRRGRDPYDLLVDLLSLQELRRIEELRLDFNSEKKEKHVYVYQLDPAVLPSNTLRVLDLASTRIELPRGGAAAAAAAFLLPRLSVLRLRKCSGPTKDLEDFIRAAPNLGSLHIERQDFDYNRHIKCELLKLHCPRVTAVTLASLGMWSNKDVELDAPCLRTLRYEGHFVDFSMKSPATELARVELAFTPSSRSYNQPEKPWFGPFWRFISSFRHAKILRLKVPNIEGIAVGKDAQHDEHLFTLFGLQRLELEGPCDPGRREDATVAIANLLECCPLMNSLQIRIINQNNDFEYRRCRKPSPDFGVSLSLFEGRYSKQVTTMIEAAHGSSQVADLPELSGCEFSCLRNHLKNVKLEFELKELNSFEVCLAKFFAENCMVLESLQIDDGKQNFLGHISWMAHRWRADALERRKQMEQDSANAQQKYRGKADIILFGNTK